MKIRRFQASTMREAMRQVREEQGPDAVILSSHRTAGGVEVVAAVDYDAALMQQALRKTEVAPAPEPATVLEEETFASLLAASPVAVSAPAAPTPAPAPMYSAVPMPQSRSVQPFVLRAPPAGPNAIRPMIEPRLAPIMQTTQAMALTQASPAVAAAVAAPAHDPNSLAALGIDPALAQKIMQEASATQGPRARFMPLGLLARRIAVMKHDLAEQGGVIALLGPTGVGKTTTLAKIAARGVRKHGANGVALISADRYRIGAQEQLATYGSLLGVPVYPAHDAAGLALALKQCAQRKLVLIDTAGVSPRDRRLVEQFRELSAQSRAIRNILVLSATAQSADIDDLMRKLGPVQPAGCIVTKLDETGCIGGALSACISAQLPIAYVTDGQRVPEDIQPARADRLVLKAMQLSRHLSASSVPPPPTASALAATGVLHAAV